MSYRLMLPAVSDGPRPTVSILTATYNRSHVLHYAIRSVLSQRWTDWELIVVGDACSDDTAEVVASYGDSRITFVNLRKNAKARVDAFLAAAAR